MSDSVSVRASWMLLTLGADDDRDAVVIYQVESDDDTSDAVFTAVCRHLAGRGFQRVTTNEIEAGDWPRGDTAAAYLAADHLVAAIIGDMSFTLSWPVPATDRWTAAARDHGNTVILAVVRAGSLSERRGDFTTSTGMVAAITDLADRRGLLAARIDLVDVPLIFQEGTT